MLLRVEIPGLVAKITKWMLLAILASLVIYIPVLFYASIKERKIEALTVIVAYGIVAWFWLRRH